MNVTATSNQKVKADNHASASAQSGNASGDGIAKTYTLINGGHRLSVAVTQNGTVVNGTGAANAVGHQGDNRTVGRVGSVAAGSTANAASSSQAVAASNQASASARSGKATGDGIGEAYVLVNGARPGSKIDVSNSGSAANRTGDASAVGQQGDNRTAGAVGQVGAGGAGASTTANASQGVAAGNCDSASARSGDARGDGIRKALTLANGIGRGSVITVSNTGSTSNTTGSATAVGQQGDNVTAGQVGRVGAAGGRGGAAATNRQAVSAANRNSAEAQSGNATGDGIGEALTLANGIGKGVTISVTNTGTARNSTGSASAVGQQGDNRTSAATGSAAADSGQPLPYGALLHDYLQAMGPGAAAARNRQAVRAINHDSASARSGDARGEGVREARTVANGVKAGSTISVANVGSASNTSGTATAVGQQGDNVTAASADRAVVGN